MPQKRISICTSRSVGSRRWIWWRPAAMSRWRRSKPSCGTWIYAPASHHWFSARPGTTHLALPDRLSVVNHRAMVWKWKGSFLQKICLILLDSRKSIYVQAGMVYYSSGDPRPEGKMDNQNDNRKRLASLLNEVAAQEGIHQTPVDGVWVARHSQPQPRTPAIYEPRSSSLVRAASGAISAARSTSTTRLTISFYRCRCRWSASGRLAPRSRCSLSPSMSSRRCSARYSLKWTSPCRRSARCRGDLDDPDERGTKRSGHPAP